MSSIKKKAIRTPANDHNIHSFTVTSQNDFAADPRCLALNNQCRRLLFEAGADPTISAGNGYPSSFYYDVLDVGATVIQKLQVTKSNY